MLAVPPDRRPDPGMLEVLRQVDRVARSLGLDYFVVGAMARDILLTGVFGLSAGRATRDVDLAVAKDGRNSRLSRRALSARARLIPTCELPTGCTRAPSQREETIHWTSFHSAEWRDQGTRSPGHRTALS